MSADTSPPSAPITTARRLMINTMLNLFNQVVTVLVNFLMVGFFLDTLGEDRYGVWILIGSVFSYRSIMSMGLNSAVNRNIPGFLIQNDMVGVRRVVSTAFAYYLLPSVVLTLMTLAVYSRVDSWFNVPAELGEIAGFITLIVGLSFAITVPLQVYSAVLSSYQRYDLINLISVSSIVVRTVLVVTMLSNGYGLLTLASLYALAELSIRLLSVAFGYRVMSGFQLSVSEINRTLLRQMMTYGVSTILYMSGAVLVFKSADLVIGSLISASAVSRFFIATTPVILLTTVVQVFAQAMKPAVSELDAIDDVERIEEMAFISQKYTLLAIVPGLTFILVMGDEFLAVWVGDRFRELGTIEELSQVLRILAIGASLRLAQHTNFIVLVGKGDHRAFGIATGIMIVACIASEISAVVVFEAGLVGVAWGCCIPMAAISVFYLPAYFSWRMKISFIESVRRSWLPALAACLPGIVLMAGFNAIRPPTSWLDLGVVIVVVGLFTAVSAWAFALRKNERERIRRMLPF